MTTPSAIYPGFTAPPMNGEGSSGATEGWPAAIQVSTADMLHSLNPLQHLPVVGMIYRAATGETIPTPMRVLGAGLVGGPLGALGAVAMSLLEELVRLGPDTSRPAAPAGMLATGSEAGVQPPTGPAQPGAYTTLATTRPDFLPDPVALAQAGAAYNQAAMDWGRAQSAETGIA